VSGKRYDCAEAMLNNGANWTVSAICTLLLQDIERVRNAINNFL